MGDFIKKAAPIFGPLATVAKGVVGFKDSIRRSNELDVQARQDRLTTQGAQVERTRRFNAILGANIASGAAGGVGAFSGSRANIGLKDARQFSLDRDTARAGSAARRSALKREAKQTRKRGRLGLGFSLFKAATGAS